MPPWINRTYLEKKMGIIKLSWDSMVVKETYLWVHKCNGSGHSHSHGSLEHHLTKAIEGTPSMQGLHCWEFTWREELDKRKMIIEQRNAHHLLANRVKNWKQYRCPRRVSSYRTHTILCRAAIRNANYENHAEIWNNMSNRKEMHRAALLGRQLCMWTREFGM